MARMKPQMTPEQQTAYRQAVAQKVIDSIPYEKYCAITPEQAAKAILAERLCDTMFLNQIDTEAQRPLADHFAAALGGSGLRIAAGSLRAGSGWLYPDIRKI